MRLQLDFDHKVIKVDNMQTINLDEFFKQIKNILPDWKKWSLKTEAAVYWYNPWTYTAPYTLSSTTSEFDGGHTLHLTNTDNVTGTVNVEIEAGV